MCLKDFFFSKRVENTSRASFSLFSKGVWRRLLCCCYQATVTCVMQWRRSSCSNLAVSLIVWTKQSGCFQHRKSLVNCVCARPADPWTGRRGGFPHRPFDKGTTAMRRATGQLVVSRSNVLYGENPRLRGHDQRAKGGRRRPILQLICIQSRTAQARRGAFSPVCGREGAKCKRFSQKIRHNPLLLSASHRICVKPFERLHVKCRGFSLRSKRLLG